MATIVELTASVQALQENLSATVTDLTARVAALEGQVDPAQLDSVKASIDQLAELAKSADPGPEPAAEVAAPAPAYFTFTGDPTTVDATVWPKADVTASNGEALYTFAAGAAPEPLPEGWTAYSGETVPVAPPAG